MLGRGRTNTFWHKCECVCMYILNMLPGLLPSSVPWLMVVICSAMVTLKDIAPGEVEEFKSRLLVGN